MAQYINLTPQGLYTFQSELSKAPEGSMRVADNIDINADDLFEIRRGFTVDDNTFGATADRADKLFDFKETLLLHYGSTMSRRSNADGTYTDYTGSFPFADPDFKLDSVQSNSNLYINPDNGIKKLDVVGGNFVDAGAPRAQDPRLALSTTAGAILPAGDTVSYKILWVRLDGNNNVVLGADNIAVNISNSEANTRNIVLSIPIPEQVDTSFMYQIYRSSAVSTGFAPLDHQLIIENGISAAQKTANVVTITDTIVDAEKGATIYTAPTQEGALAGNLQPPLAKTMSLFKGHVFFGNVVNKHRLLLTLDRTGATGLNTGDNLILTSEGVSITFNGAGTEVLASRQFLVNTANTAAAIEETMRSLVNVINANATTYAAYYLSGTIARPGQILIEKDTLDDEPFTIIASTATSGGAFRPNITALVSSVNDEFLNGVAFSKPGEPEAFPLTNRFRIGSADKKILKMVVNRNSLLVFKEDGLFRIFGDDAENFEVQELDLTVRLIAPETVQSLRNHVYALTTQGVVRISDNRVVPISRRIENQVNGFFNRPDLLGQRVFAVASESDRKYILFYVSSLAEATPTVALVYNVFTNTWVRWILNTQTGIVFDDKITLADSTGNNIRIERKNLNNTDYADQEIAVTITNVDEFDITLSDASEVEVGDGITIGTTGFAYVRAVNGNIVTMSAVNGVVGSATLNKHIPILVEYNAVDADNPGAGKYWKEITYMFRKLYPENIEVDFLTDVDISATPTVIPGRSGTGQWGQFNWGFDLWSGDDNLFTPRRTYVPRDKGRSTVILPIIRHSVAFSEFQMSGYSLVFDLVSDRTTRI